MGLLLFGLVLGVFLPAIRNGFICYDDPEYVTENLRVQGGPTLSNLKWALTADRVNWHPLTWVSHMVDCQVYGLRPAGHHFMSVLLHALNTMLLFLAFQRMTGALGRSFALAALFGLHPLRVESVAWIAERKDVLCGLFFMLTLLAYAQYAQRRKLRGPRCWAFYALAVTSFALGLMSKPMLVTTPLVLLLLDWWPLNRIAIPNRSRSVAIRLLLEKVPFILLAAVSSVITFRAQHGSGAVFESLTLAMRSENALVSYGRYIGKLFWPVDLAVFYPHPGRWPPVIVLACAGLIAAVCGLAIRGARRQPYLPVGGLWFLGTLVPVLGLVQVGAQSMADRYTYIPGIGLLVMIVWGLHGLAARWRSPKIPLTAIGTAAGLVCATLTIRQIGWWQDSETLFRHAIAVTGENSVALDNLGRALREKGRPDEAIEQYGRAIRLNSNDAFARNGLGVLLMQKGDLAGAALHLQEALRVDPRNAFAHGNLGVVLAGRGELDEAISHLEDSVRIQPDNPEAQNNLGALLAGKGHLEDAILHYRAALRVKPDYAKARKNLGVVLVQMGRLDDAIEQFREAVRLQPDFADAQEKLRAALELKAKANSPAAPPLIP